MAKHFVLDTNILLTDPHAMVNGFDDNEVILCGTTLQELDSKKTLGGEIGYNARECCRILDALRKKGDLKAGIPLDNGGTLRVFHGSNKENILPNGYDLSRADNRIIANCILLGNIFGTETEPVILVTNDISMRVNASICGVEVESYRNDQIQDISFTGHREVEVEPEMISAIYAQKTIVPEAGHDFHPNEFLTLRAGEKQTALAVFHNQSLELIEDQRLYLDVEPKNAMQRFAIWALTAPAEDIPLVILRGGAGTAKTFLSLAAGLNETHTSQKKRDGRYYKMLISRPNVETSASPGFGYLPGDLQSKMEPLLFPYYDNLESLFAGAETNGAKDEYNDVQWHIDDLFASGVIDLCPLNYIRGRSLNNVYLICDEAQNATKGLVRDIITRAGKGTKVVLCGDPDQIDAPTLDKRNNGLVYATEKMKDSPLSAIITFEAKNSVRSALAKEAISRM